MHLIETMDRRHVSNLSECPINSYVFLNQRFIDVKMGLSMALDCGCLDVWSGAVSYLLCGTQLF
jgi:hypothetical protein